MRRNARRCRTIAWHLKPVAPPGFIASPGRSRARQSRRSSALHGICAAESDRLRQPVRRALSKVPLQGADIKAQGKATGRRPGYRGEKNRALKGRNTDEGATSCRGQKPAVRSALSRGVPRPGILLRRPQGGRTAGVQPADRKTAFPPQRRKGAETARHGERTPGFNGQRRAARRILLPPERRPCHRGLREHGEGISAQRQRNDTPSLKGRAPSRPLFAWSRAESRA